MFAPIGYVHSVSVATSPEGEAIVPTRRGRFQSPAIDIGDELGHDVFVRCHDFVIGRKSRR